jgi:hypothetical protein
VSFSFAQLAAFGHAASVGRTRRYDRFADLPLAHAGCRDGGMPAAAIANDDRKFLLFTPTPLK